MQRSAREGRGPRRVLSSRRPLARRAADSRDRHPRPRDPRDHRHHHAGGGRGLPRGRGGSVHAQERRRGHRGGRVQADDRARGPLRGGRSVRDRAPREQAEGTAIDEPAVAGGAVGADAAGARADARVVGVCLFGSDHIVRIPPPVRATHAGGAAVHGGGTARERGGRSPVSPIAPDHHRHAVRGSVPDPAHTPRSRDQRLLTAHRRIRAGVQRLVPPPDARVTSIQPLSCVPRHAHLCHAHAPLGRFRASCFLVAL